MRINTRIEHYDVQSLEDIMSTVEQIREQCRALVGCGEYLTRKTADAHEQFDTVNYNRTKEALERFLKKMEAVRAEMDELLVSCRQFTEKIERDWAP